MKPADRPLTYDRLIQVLSYNRRSGIFRWRISLSKRNHIGDQAGTIGSDGYRIIQIDGWHYKAGRLAWLYCHRRWPNPLADHKNRKRDDNRIRNLREATNTQNCTNVGMLRNNTSGFKGVSRISGTRRKPFRAAIRVGEKRLFLGYFKTARSAGRAYCNAAKKYHGKFAGGVR